MKQDPDNHTKISLVLWKKYGQNICLANDAQGLSWKMQEKLFNKKGAIGKFAFKLTVKTKIKYCYEDFIFCERNGNKNFWS